MKNKEVHCFVIQSLLMLGILVFISFFYYGISKEHYSAQLLEGYNHLINPLLEKYPELEEEIIDIITKNKNPDSKNVLEKYGITEENASYLSILKNRERESMLLFIGFLSIGFLTIFFFYMFRMLRFQYQLRKLNRYISDILSDREGTKLTDYEEGTFSILKNDIYKITWELMENKAYLKKDKKYLEETLSDISHQLKTPLTSMYMINDFLEKDDLDKKTKKEFLSKNRTQLERIEWLVTSLLKLSRLESGTIHLKKEQVNVQKLLEESLVSLRIPIELAEQELVFHIDEKLTLLCDANWTREVLVNIIKNAHEHTKSKGTVNISTVENPIFKGIEITDTGEGMEEEDLHHIFERFYKGKSSSKESIGIGLHMAKNIMTRQNGTIDVSSERGKGTTFLIKFYKGK